MSHPEAVIVNAFRTFWLSFCMRVCYCAKWRPYCFKMFPVSSMSYGYIPFHFFHCNHLVLSAACTRCPRATKLGMSGRTRSAHEHHHRCLMVGVPEALWPQQMLSADVDSGPHILLHTGALANEDPEMKDTKPSQGNRRCSRDDPRHSSFPIL